MRPAFLALLLLIGPGSTLSSEELTVQEVGLGFRAKGRLPNLQYYPDQRKLPTFMGRMDTWMPFQVTLKNTGPAVEGTLLLRESYTGASTLLEYRKHLSLPPGARKRITFPVFYRSVSPLELTFEDDRHGELRLGHDTTLLVPNPRTVAPVCSLVLVATESQENFAHFLRRRGPNAYAQKHYLVPVSPAQLPANAIEYHGVDALVLDDLPLEALGEPQTDAIAQFVARGGLLLVCLLRHSERLAGTRLETLLPALPTGLHNTSELASLERAVGIECRLDSPIAVTSFTLREGAEAWEEFSPVIAHRPFEQGLVVVCGFPLSAKFLSTWPGAPWLMDLLANFEARALIPLAGEGDLSGLRSDLALALKDSMIREIPPFAYVLGIMLVYCLLVGVVPYFAFRWLGRTEWAWACIVLIALIGSGAVYGLGLHYYREDSYAYRIGLIEGGGEEGFHLRHNFWSLFSAEGARLDLDFEESCTIPFPFGTELVLRGADTAQDSMTLSFDGARLQNLPTYTQDSTLFETTDTQMLEGQVALLAGPLGRLALFCSPSMPVARAWVAHSGNVKEVRVSAGEQLAVEPLDAPYNPVVGLPGDVLEAEPGDRLLACSLQVLLKHIARVSLERSRPVLLYLHEGTPALTNRGIPEHCLDFGLAVAPRWLDHAGPRSWRLRRTTLPPQGSYDEALYSEEGVEFAAYLNLPQHHQLHNIRVSWGRERRYGPATVEVFDWKAGAWSGVTSNRNYGIEGFVHVTPLRSAHARLRVRIDPEQESRHRQYYYYYHRNLLETLDVESWLEKEEK